MSILAETPSDAREALNEWLSILRAPKSLTELSLRGDTLISKAGESFPITRSGIPLFAQVPLTADARAQQQHYERIAAAYFENLSYPHTEAYMGVLDEAMNAVVPERVGASAEICCGRGEAMELYGTRMTCGIGVDISLSMLEAAKQRHVHGQAVFVQGDATMLPLADASLDSVFMLGGIHHVSDRALLFREVARVLKPGGKFYFREPVSDFPLWYWIRWIVYRVSPTLDHNTEKPLRYDETVPYLDRAGLELVNWRTHGFFGFCLFMNSDVLVFNKLFRFIPGIRAIARASAWLDEAILCIPGFGRWGLQVVGIAQKAGDRTA
jgi:ubiquinone/menaquinone biosynthesis C-methylase UbiE